MNTSIIYNPKKHTIRDILQLNNEGIDILCHRCRSKILIIDSKELVAKYKKPQGIYCPKNENHVWIKFILREEREYFWQNVEKRLTENNCKDKT